MEENPAGHNSPRIIDISLPADGDLFAIYNYTARRWGENQAEEYLEFLHSVMERLADRPGLAAFVPGRKNTRVFVAQWAAARHGHRIFFRETDYGILILRILHTAMNWPEHLADDE